MAVLQPVLLEGSRVREHARRVALVVAYSPVPIVARVFGLDALVMLLLAMPLVLLRRRMLLEAVEHGWHLLPGVGAVDATIVARLVGVGEHAVLVGEESVGEVRFGREGLWLAQGI